MFFDFTQYNFAINQMKKKNLTSVRIGEIKDDTSITSNSSYIDATGERNSNHNLLQLVYGSEFIVTITSGIAEVSRMLRKPQLFVNYIPFMINDFSAWAANSFYITKKIFDHKKTDTLI